MQMGELRPVPNLKHMYSSSTIAWFDIFMFKVFGPWYGTRSPSIVCQLTVGLNSLSMISTVPHQNGGNKTGTKPKNIIYTYIVASLRLQLVRRIRTVP